MEKRIVPPKVVEKECIGCKRCVTVCPGYVLEMSGDKSTVVRAQWCIGCGHCGAVCPTGAILYEGRSFDPRPGKGESPAVAPEMLELLLRERRSVRVYTRDTVPEEALNRILDAGRFAPTGSNSQNVHYIVLKSTDRIDVLQKMVTGFYDKMFSRVRGKIGALLVTLIAGRRAAEYLRESLPKAEFANERMKEGKDPLFYHAPVVLVAHAESWDPCSSFNCSVALYHCSLMAHTLGLGACFNGFLVIAANRVPKIKKWLGIPADHQCYAAMTLGFPELKYPRLVHRRPPKVTNA
jgi:nitroreductase/NAD-dependent dihydropyrimidine dehydrogenase PreA subunit